MGKRKINKMKPRSVLTSYYHDCGSLILTKVLLKKEIKELHYTIKSDFSLVEIKRCPKCHKTLPLSLRNEKINVKQIDFFISGTGKYTA